MMLTNQNPLLRELAARGEEMSFDLGGLLFNAAVDAQALAIVKCRDTAHLSSVIRVASEHGTPMAVLGGGHDLSGRGFVKDNLILDLRALSSVTTDSDSMTVTIGGGTLSGDLIENLPPHLVSPLGTVSTVGVTGLALCGGYGRLTSSLGLTSDTLERAEVVLADGTIAIASEEDDHDLLWAIRGGGSGFGVVTSCRLKLHHMPEVLISMHIYPMEHAHRILLLCQDLIDLHPTDLNLFMGFMTGPNGQPVLFVSPTWTGDRNIGEALVGDLQADKSALTVQNGWMPYKMTFDKEAEKAWPKGRNYSLPTQTVQRLDRETVEILIQAALNFTSPFSALVIHDFHGVATRIAPTATAFPLRSAHFVIEIISAWDGVANGQISDHLAWANAVSASLGTVSLPGGYPNLLSPHEGERARQFFGGSAERLKAIKSRVDPDDLFRSATGRIPT
ncbi:FAD-binding oxidoreductase [Phyllobacterium ifriqiyense]|uniref:FAD-binding oxidoreductase n=1 Tax=Phyllobacterium ifriqiyense TaxID=314238 RepID=UPI00339B355A